MRKNCIIAIAFLLLVSLVGLLLGDQRVLASSTDETEAMVYINNQEEFDLDAEENIENNDNEDLEIFTEFVKRFPKIIMTYHEYNDTSYFTLDYKINVFDVNRMSKISAESKEELLRLKFVVNTIGEF